MLGLVYAFPELFDNIPGEIRGEFFKVIPKEKEAPTTLQKLDGDGQKEVEGKSGGIDLDGLNFIAAKVSEGVLNSIDPRLTNIENGLDEQGEKLDEQNKKLSGLKQGQTNLGGEEVNFDGRP